MKKNLIPLVAAGLLILGTACNSDSGKGKGELSHAEEMETGMQHKTAEEDHTTTSTASNASSEVPAFEQVSESAQQHVGKLTQSYLRLKDALVKEDAAGSKAATEQMLLIMKSFDSMELPQEQQQYYANIAEELTDKLQQLSSTTDISLQREHFAPLSNQLYALNKAFAAQQPTLYYQHCPMAFDNKGAYWLSAEKEIQNPYYGDKMLKCGRVVERL